MKCARVVGDVMGKYHPHGDTAIYDTLVRMAQEFSLRYPLVDGQGNFGSVDGDNAAAMRYTECRLEKIAAELTADIDKETVDFVPNYDGKEQEPAVLPSRLPNLLVNGSSGIAVGMATNIPPHNLTETIDGCLAVLDNPEITVDELMEHHAGAGLPDRRASSTAWKACARATAPAAAASSSARARTSRTSSKGGRQAIIVDEIPYQVNKANLLDAHRRAGRATRSSRASPTCATSRDKSGMRVVIELKRGEVPEIVLNNLYKLTQLQDSFGMNMVALVDGQPRLLNLKQFLEFFLIHRREVVMRRTRLRAAQGARARPHPGRPRGRAVERRRDHRADQGVADAARGQGRADGADVALVGGRGDAAARGGRRRAPGRAAGGVRLAANGRLPAVRRAGAGDPRTAPAAADRPRAGQDHRRIPRSDGADRRPARHPRQARARHEDHPRRTRRRSATSSATSAARRSSRRAWTCRSRT